MCVPVWVCATVSHRNMLIDCCKLGGGLFWDQRTWLESNNLNVEPIFHNFGAILKIWLFFSLIDPNLAELWTKLFSVVYNIYIIFFVPLQSLK